MSKQRAPWFCQDCRVPMLYSKKLDYHICPKCKATVQHSDETDQYVEDEIIALMRDLVPTHKDRDFIPLTGKGGHGKGGSSNRTKKPKSKKLSLSQLNMKLHNEV